MDTFITKSGMNKAAPITSLVMWVILSLLGFFALRVTVALFVFVEVIILSASVFTYFTTAKASRWTLRFENSFLYLQNGVGKSYVVQDIPATDFVFTQNEKQRAENKGNLSIKNTVFAMSNVENFSALKAYVAAHF